MRSRGAARAQPAHDLPARGLLKQRGAACDVGALVLVGEQRRDHVHGIGMGQHLVPGLGHRLDRLGRTLRDHRIDHDARHGAVAGEGIEQAVDAAPDPVGGPGDRHGVEHAGRQRIAHRADAGRLAVRPRLEADVEDHRDLAAARPDPVRLLPHVALRSDCRRVRAGGRRGSALHIRFCRFDAATRRVGKGGPRASIDAPRHTAMPTRTGIVKRSRTPRPSPWARRNAHGAYAATSRPPLPSLLAGSLRPHGPCAGGHVSNRACLALDRSSGQPVSTQSADRS